MSAKTYTVPIGPVHVGLKEPITAWLDLDGEKIVGARVRPGANGFFARRASRPSCACLRIQVSRVSSEGTG